MALYDAFISYSHAKDKPIAAALQSAVQKLGKPWYRRRALRVFRDDTSLSATPQLWPSIERALGETRYFLLLASPEAAASKWVNKEVAYWLDHNSIDTLLIGVTAGELGWDETTGDFAADDAMPLPPVLAGRFPVEPKWVDLRPYRDNADRGDAKFTDLAADFAAAIRGMPKEDLLSQEVRQQRRALTLAWSAAGSLLLLAGAATAAGVLAYRAQQEAIAQRNRAEQTLAAATDTANGLVFNLAQRFKFAVGIPVELVKDILDRAVALQQQLTKSGQTTPALRESEGAALNDISFALVRIGDTTGAFSAADRARQIFEELLAVDPDNAHWQDDLEISYQRLGNVLMRQQKYAEAMAAYEHSRAIAQRLADAKPDDADRQDNLSISLEKIGDALREQGRLDARNLAKALDAFRQALAIRKKLYERPEVTDEWRFGLAVAYGKIGDVLKMQGKTGEAIGSYQDYLAIMLKLTADKPGNSEWQNELVVTYGKLGEAYIQDGKNADALDAFEKCIALLAKLLDRDPKNGEWQGMMALGQEKVGDVLSAMGKYAEAAEAYQKTLTVRQKLAELDSRNGDRQNSVALAYSHIGNALQAQGKAAEALSAYEEGRAIWQKLLAVEPDNNRWQYGLSVMLDDIGLLLMEQGKPAEALDRFRAALAEQTKLVERNPGSGFLRRASAISHGNIGDAFNAQGDRAAAIAAYREKLMILRALAEEDRTNTPAQIDVALSLWELAIAGDDARTRLTEALAILNALKAENRLPPSRESAIAQISAAIEKLAQASIP